MKMQEILKMSLEELENKVQSLKKELFYLRFELALGKLTNTAQLRKLKKSIAHIKTVLTQKNTNLKSTSIPKENDSSSNTPEETTEELKKKLKNQNQ
ncbi:50S ribosomal protein L29 [Candidatus Phytoplasma australiense]|uniref:Large ribosomal subunit protein uL29 n=2 Tax=Phytoplasma australiense TaxID=59748 RepID=B1VAE0_PHYAS|nr:50S ribosomal protein L29 [Strawberry lethal yellows phytoplasma (CPA) str. NZSb11]CAM11913.1 50S ribosomal protein L29 [Candidatus Phytoplasma australiense]